MITKVRLKENHPYNIGFAVRKIEEVYRDSFLPKFQGSDWAVHGYDEINNNMVFSAFHGDYQYKHKYYYNGLYLPLYFKGLGDIIVYDARYVIWD